MIVETKGNTYEIDKPGRRIRRLGGASMAPIVTPNWEWQEFEAILGLTFGSYPRIIFPGGRGVDLGIVQSIRNTSVTSL